MCGVTDLDLARSVCAMFSARVRVMNYSFQREVPKQAREVTQSSGGAPIFRDVE
jgi:hypothetical protein